jgi:hypothetical protein
MIRKMILISVLMWPAGLRADNLSADFTQDDLVLFDRDALPAGWVTRESPERTKVMAGAVASAVSANLDSAMLQIDCIRQPAPAHLKISLHYWLAGRPEPGHRYALDLFNSVGSLRPAAYDLGLGSVSTAGIDHNFSSDGPLPAAYYAAIDAFLTPLAQGQATQVMVSFTTPESSDGPGRSYAIEFPLYHLREAAVLLQGDCPPTP